jgi:hypothetical protein
LEVFALQKLLEIGMKRPRPMYVLQRADTNQFVDCLHADLNHPSKWQWADTIHDARWLRREGLPSYFYSEEKPDEPQAKIKVVLGQGVPVWDEGEDDLQMTIIHEIVDCPVCGMHGAMAICDEADVGVGIITGNHAAECKNCGMVWECKCGLWLSEGHDHQNCPAEV